MCFILYITYQTGRIDRSAIFLSDVRYILLACIHISDTGSGIKKENFKKIFSPGFTSKKRGWGLGLSLAKRIITDYHKGKISVKTSELGKGTIFEIVLKK